jgi:hypothetical protein
MFTLMVKNNALIAITIDKFDSVLYIFFTILIILVMLKHKLEL